MKTKRGADDFDTVVTGPGVRLYRGTDAAQALSRAQQELGQVEVLQGRHLRRGGLGGLFAEDLGVEIAVRKIPPGPLARVSSDNELVEIARQVLLANAPTAAPGRSGASSAGRGSFTEALIRAGVPVEVSDTAQEPDLPTGRVLNDQLEAATWDGTLIEQTSAGDAGQAQHDYTTQAPHFTDNEKILDERAAFDARRTLPETAAVKVYDHKDEGNQLGEGSNPSTDRHHQQLPDAEKLELNGREPHAERQVERIRDVGEATWGPVRSRARRLVTADELVELGVAAHLAYDCVDVEELVSLMRGMTPGLPMAPPRGVSAVVGPLDAAWALADEIFDRVVILERPLVRGIKPLQTAMLRQMSRPGSTGVVIGAGELPTDDEALRKVVSTIRPIEVRVVTDASWAEMRMWRAAQVPGRLVMDLVNLASTGRPCTALRIGIPVVSLDGRPADERTWADLILRRLGKI